MNSETEKTVRSILRLAENLSEKQINHTVNLLRGVNPEEEELVKVLNQRTVAKLLHVRIETVICYAKKGYFHRIFGCGKHAIGITEKSFIMFTKRTSNMEGSDAVRLGVTPDWENVFRGILEADPEVRMEDVNRAASLLRGHPLSREDLVHAVKFKEACRILKVTMPTLNYYLQRGYISRVYGRGKKALGISLDSIDRFRSKRVIRHIERTRRKIENCVD